MEARKCSTRRMNIDFVMVLLLLLGMCCGKSYLSFASSNKYAECYDPCLVKCEHGQSDPGVYEIIYCGAYCAAQCYEGGGSPMSDDKDVLLKYCRLHCAYYDCTTPKDPSHGAKEDEICGNSCSDECIKRHKH